MKRGEGCIPILSMALQAVLTAVSKPIDFSGSNVIVNGAWDCYCENAPVIEGLGAANRTVAADYNDGIYFPALKLAMALSMPAF